MSIVSTLKHFYLAIKSLYGIDRTELQTKWSLKMRTEEETSVLVRLHGMLSNQPIWMPHQFGDVIRALLNKAHLPVSKVATALEHSELIIQAWERDLRLPEKEQWPSLTASVIILIEAELD
jgi:hypothetical protein